MHDAKDSGNLVIERTIGRVLQQFGLRSKTACRLKYKTDNSRYHDVVINTLAKEFNTDKPNVVG